MEALHLEDKYKTGKTQSSMVKGPDDREAKMAMVLYAGSDATTHRMKSDRDGLVWQAPVDLVCRQVGTLRWKVLLRTL